MFIAGWYYNDCEWGLGCHDTCFSIFEQVMFDCLTHKLQIINLLTTIFRWCEQSEMLHTVQT
jgi:hypothetical protein